MKIYLAGPMRGYPEFNFPLFHRAAKMLRELGHEVFSPAERDIERHGGVDISKGNTTGSLADAVDVHQFSAREAIHDDLVFIAKEADAIALLPGWEMSSGASGPEFALAKFLKGAGVDFRFIYLFLSHGALYANFDENYDAIHNP
jgi:hypothetical protein